MSFKDIDTNEFKSGKSNPLTKGEQQSKAIYATHTTKVLEEDHARLKTYAFKDDKKMFEVAHDALKMYEMFHNEGKKLGLSTNEAAAKAIELLKNSK
ncbi:TPA: hypothetical protein ACOQ31_005875 [Bacillus cereus]|uniref:hypothetical protein n=1 Tax=Bacillus cereus group TaxID=86661 RepID=UPI0002795F55|nr:MULTISPECIES: hypothetical protein [Bacillus cereus group]EJR03259.1 hypothetical protein II7_05714 [Bacillus cereus MSX-A12]MBL3769043.1 hypothetical protein [Bacillus cereus]MCM3202734.1 hypothetical protein [Bacillus cereus]OUB77057.1 hypothetical protein BK744_09285 [Bacillus thuringiensis serovar zhaodongensis]PEW74475.1 hypothetical protein CN449_14395 [Bacillus thuringiensis]